MQPKVTIITGYYNRAEYVDYSIQSLLDQTFNNFELIIFDDCSKDETYDRLLEFAQRDDRIVLIRHEKNIGFVRGLINAMTLAKGEYIAIHGSGDISLNNRIYKQNQFLDKNISVQVVGCHYVNKDPHNNKKKYTKGQPLYKRESLFLSNPLSHGEVMFRKSIYEKVGGYRSIFKFSQDKDLWLRMSKYGDIAIIQEILYERIINYEGVSYKVEKLIDQKKYSHLASIINQLSDKDQDGIIKKVELEGIDVVVNIEEKFIQRNIFKMFNVLFVKNKLNNTSLFIDNSKGLFRLYYIIFGKMYNLLLFRRVVNTIYKFSSPNYQL